MIAPLKIFCVYYEFKFITDEKALVVKTATENLCILDEV